MIHLVGRSMHRSNLIFLKTFRKMKTHKHVHAHTHTHRPAYWSHEGKWAGQALWCGKAEVSVLQQRVSFTTTVPLAFLNPGWKNTEKGRALKKICRSFMWTSEKLLNIQPRLLYLDTESATSPVCPYLVFLFSGPLLKKWKVLGAYKLISNVMSCTALNERKRLARSRGPSQWICQNFMIIHSIIP